MLITTLKQKLVDWEKRTQTRIRKIITKRNGNSVIVDGIECVNFCSSDYLGLANHSQIVASFIHGANQYGVGSGSASFISGYFHDQHELEMRFAEWLKVDKAILFNCGYLANLGVIATLADRNSTVISDKLCHASILDGIQLSRAKHYRYQHRSMPHLRKLTETYPPDMIITESVFSMEGDIAPVNDIIAIGQQCDAAIVIDDAHGIGVLGKNGGGICEVVGINQEQFTCLLAPLGKAFNGFGAIAAGKQAVIEAILQFARTYRYTTALPPAICSALLKTLDIVIQENWRREKLNHLIHYFVKNAIARGLTIAATDITPIKSIIIGDNDTVLEIQQALLSKGFFISSIRPPTVPEHTARIRISLNCQHEEVDIIQLLDHIVDMVTKAKKLGK